MPTSTEENQEGSPVEERLEPASGSQRAVERLARAFESGATRKRFLARAVATAGVFAAGPIRFLLYPAAARAATPGSCPAGTMCHDSAYTTFCCTLSGGSNDCPSGTAVGGWWYANVGSGYCSNGTLRYYVDCLSSNCSCTCANNSCGNRHQCCNGGYTSNCNGPNSGNVYCRVVRCVNPCNITWPGGITCSCSGSSDQNTCCHSSGSPNCNFAAPTCAACGGHQ